MQNTILHILFLRCINELRDKFRFGLSIIFICLNFGLFSQPCNIPPFQYYCNEVESNGLVLPCPNALNGVCSQLSDSLVPNLILCGDNQTDPHCYAWYGFVATSTNLIIKISSSGYCNSAGRLNVGIISDCTSPSTSEIVCITNCNAPPFTLTIDDLIPGNTYFLYVGDCHYDNCFSICNFSFSVPVEIEKITGPKKICQGGNYTYSIPKVNTINAYHWTLNGVLLSDPLTEDEQIELNIALPGVYTLCVDVSNECLSVNDPPAPQCIDITVGSTDGTDPKPAYVCPGKVYTYAGNSYGVGVYDVALPSKSGCDSLVTLTVNEISVPDNNLGVVYKCNGDCLTIKDKWGSSFLFCDDVEDEEVKIKSYNGCDSLVKFSLRIVRLKPEILKPKELGCSVTKAELDATVTQIENANNLKIKWTALNGGVLSGPDNELLTYTETGGKYCLTISGSAPNGIVCKDSSCVIVKADPNAPTATIKGDTLSCFKDSILLIGSSSTPGVSFSWLVPDSTLYAGDTISVDTPGVYVLSITTPTNCVVKTSYNVILNKGVDSLFIGIIGDTITCIKDSVHLSGTSSLPGSSFSWIGPGSFTSNSQNIEVDQTGSYTLTVSSSKLCSVDTSFNVIALKSIPNATATGEIIDCISGQTTLVGNSTTPNATFKWLDSIGNLLSTDKDLIAPSSGSYKFEVTDPINGCTKDTIVEAVTDANAPTLSITKSSDLDCKSTSVDISANSTTPGVGFLWEDGSTGLTINTTTPGTFSVTVTNTQNGCKNIASITVFEDKTKPILSATTDTIKCNNNKTAYVDGSSDVTSNISVFWKDPSENTLSNTLDFSTTASQIIKLIVINNTNGCQDSIYLFIPENITVPSFSLVGDTINCIEPLAIAKSNTQTPNVSYQWTGPNGSGYSSTSANASGISKEGEYTLVVTDKVNGCSDIKTVSILIDITVPGLNAEGGILNCANNHQIKLSASSPVLNPNFNWTGPGGFSSLVPDPIVTIAGSYYVSVTDGSNGCIADTSVIVGEDEEYPYLTVNNASIDCINKQVNLTASSPVPGVVYTWNGPGVVNDPNPVITTSTPGDYTCIATAPNGCSSTKTAKVTLDVVYPIVLIQTDGTLSCIKSSINITTNGSSSGSEYNYSWSGPAGSNPSGSSLNTAVPGTYVLTISNTINGCKKDTSITLNQIAKPNSITSEKQDPTCFGFKDGKISITAIGGGTPPYKYSLNGGAFTTKTDYINLAPGTYKLSIKDVLGCTYDTTYNLIQPIKLSVDAGRDTLINWGTQIELNASPNISGNYNVTWQPLLDSSCINCLHQSIILFNNQIFTVTIKDINDCEASDDVILRVNKTRPVYIPNVFSPNGDGINDVFYIQSKDNIIEEIEDFRIYDRWGEAVFEEQHCPPNDPSCGWNGKYKERYVNPAVFVYWAKIKFKDGSTEIFKGDVTVRR